MQYQSRSTPKTYIYAKNLRSYAQDLNIENSQYQTQQIVN
jgi:hypothetical protein